LAAVVEPHFVAAIEAGQAPSLSYGVVRDGRLVVTHGLGQRVPGTPAGPPDEHSVFRIASMTKSFTAATTLSLRDDGLLSLDDPVHEHVPELAGDSTRSITVRHLLTMGAGFLTDDPWGDRQHSLSPETFRALLVDVAPVLCPGERFEYSNLGYAVLGLVLESVTSMPFADLVEMRLLAPLGLRATSFTPHAEAMPGFVRRRSGWVQEPPVAHGAFSPMGGLHSSVEDLARWVSVFQSPSELFLGLLSAGSIREMQRTQRLVGAATSEGGIPVVTGYGFGLFEEFGPLGRFVFHSGGYPGFGSHMRWHPGSGLGIIALANSTYAPMSVVAARALNALLEALDAPLHAVEPSLPGLDEAVGTALHWLLADEAEGESAAVLRALFADNVEQDVPWSERLLEWAELREEGAPEVKGELRPSPGVATVDLASGGRRWRLTVMMAPHDPRLVQSVTVRPHSDDSPGTGSRVVLS
jgi:CubicO group peptidase (beta-lactamase class C family)